MRDAIRERGAEVGFEFRKEGRDRIYNTFDAHRLLHWAGTLGPDRQHALKKALLKAYFTEGRSPAQAPVLIDAAAQAGLDPARAAEILEGDEFTGEVRERQKFYQDHGIHAVPAVIVNDRHLIQGGQPPEVFEQALRQIAAQSVHDDGTVSAMSIVVALPVRCSAPAVRPIFSQRPRRHRVLQWIASYADTIHNESALRARAAWARARQ